MKTVIKSRKRLFRNSSNLMFILDLKTRKEKRLLNATFADASSYIQPSMHSKDILNLHTINGKTTYALHVISHSHWNSTSLSTSMCTLESSPINVTYVKQDFGKEVNCPSIRFFVIKKVAYFRDHKI